MKKQIFKILFVWSFFSLFLAHSPNLCWSQNHNRDRWQKPDKVIDAIGIKEGMVIGEAGAGAGYFTIHLAKQVGEKGIIYANDISQYSLNRLKRRCEREDINNVKTILGEVKDPLFPKNKLDMVIMVYVFHHLDKPVDFLENIKPSLKESAPLVILEQDPDKFDDAKGHFYKKEKILKEVKKSGFKLDRIETFLPRDTIYIYRLN